MLEQGVTLLNPKPNTASDSGPTQNLLNPLSPKGPKPLDVAVCSITPPPLCCG